MTASPEKVVVAIDGSDAEVRFTTNGLCEVEGAFGGQSLERIGEAMKGGRAGFSIVRTLFRALLLHDRPEMSEVQAGRHIEALGTEEVARVIQAAFDAWKAGALGRKVELPELDARGRLAFEANGVRYVLAYGFNAMAEMEPVFPGMTMPEIAAELTGGSGVSVNRLRAMFRAALIDDRETSLFEAGDLMDRIGVATISDAVGKAFVGAFPKVPKDDGDQGDGGEAEGNRKARRAASSGKANPTKPRQPRGGTGKP